MDGRNPYFEQPPTTQRAPRISFSAIEMLHLAMGVAVLTYAFAVARGPDKFPDKLVPGTTLLLASGLAVVTGFVLHELAHKIVAQRYGYWAEFRAAVVGLFIALALAIGAGVLAALPGATWIRGSVTRKQSGVISLVGPVLNLVVAWAAFPFSIALNRNDVVPTVFSMVAQVNAVLAVFNMLPFALGGVALDGRKVLRWNAPTWGIMFALSLGSAVYIYMRTLGIGF